MFQNGNGPGLGLKGTGAAWCDQTGNEDLFIGNLQREKERQRTALSVRETSHPLNVTRRDTETHWLMTSHNRTNRYGLLVFLLFSPILNLFYYEIRSNYICCCQSAII